MRTNAMVEIAVAPKTAYPDEYAPFTVMTMQGNIPHEYQEHTEDTDITYICPYPKPNVSAR
jgi:hypothetical protein